jgi:pSer/pThr/pTyr-binding forkhead associated (FHA) protein
VADASTAAGPLVLARLCPQDHANPPTSATCAACGAGLLPDAVQVARPRLGRMRISTGELVDLDQSLVIGRQPSVSRVQGGVMPRLVQVASPGGDISRSHVEVRLEGWHVMLCDLKATNGTVLVREGQPPRRLAQNEMAILLDGDIAELGDNISLRFEEIL